MKRWLWLTEFCALVPERALCGPQSKTPQSFLIEAFSIWLLDLGSNQGPTD